MSFIKYQKSKTTFQSSLNSHVPSYNHRIAHNNKVMRIIVNGQDILQYLAT